MARFSDDLAIPVCDSSSGSVSAPWFAVQVQSRREAAVAESLRHSGLDPFLPLYRVRARWSDRIKTVERCLFPGYLFCRLDPDARLTVLLTRHVIQILGAGRELTPVPDADIERVRLMVASPLTLMPCAYVDPKVGDRVRIRSGPLAGLEGIVQRSQHALRVVVSLEMLQRSIAAEVELDWLEYLSSPKKTTL